MGCNIKIHLLDHLDSPENVGALNDEHGERFHQQIPTKSDIKTN